MKIILPVIAVFFICCIFYGIYAGVRGILNWLEKLADLGGTHPTTEVGEMPQGEPYSGNYIDDLEKLHDLYKTGVLTQEEFQTLKKRILGGQIHSQ